MHQYIIDQLYIEHSEWVRNYFRRHSFGYFTDDDVDDLVTEVFVKIWRKLDTYEDRGVPIRGWIARIMRNHLIDARRRNTYKQNSMRILRVDSDVVDDYACYTMEFDSTQEDDYGIPYECLTDAQLEVVTIKYGGNLTIPEVAAYVGRPMEGVKAQHYRALNTLRRAMQCA